MAPKLSLGAAPSALTRSSCTRTPSPTTLSLGQTRAATFIHRARRPYTFTQLIQLSDGSTFTARTTSPTPIFRADKDSRNTLLWQPSERTLKNVEADEAGKLAAFRQRFGHGFDMSAKSGDEAAADAAAAAALTTPRKGGRALREGDIKKMEAERAAKAEAARIAEEDDELDLGDLISGYAAPEAEPKKAKPTGAPKSKGKRK